MVASVAVIFTVSQLDLLAQHLIRGLLIRSESGVVMQYTIYYSTATDRSHILAESSWAEYDDIFQVFVYSS